MAAISCASKPSCSKDFTGRETSAPVATMSAVTSGGDNDRERRAISALLPVLVLVLYYLYLHWHKYWYKFVPRDLR